MQFLLNKAILCNIKAISEAVKANIQIKNKMAVAGAVNTRADN